MSQTNRLAQYYVELLLRLGLLRFSLSVALILVALFVSIEILFDLLLYGQIKYTGIIQAALFGVIFSLCAISFFSYVVAQLAESRDKLSNLLLSLEEAHASDLVLNAELRKSIKQLNQEINKRERIEKALYDSMRTLKEKSSKLENARAKLAEQTALLRSVLNLSPDLIYYRNQKGELLSCNRALEALTGKFEQELIGLTPWQIYPHSQASKIVKTDKYVFDNEAPITCEHWLSYPDGHQACFEMRKIPFYSDKGALLGVLGFDRDITEHKSQQQALEKASRDKTTFISTISHELRTPLNAIVGFSEQLLDTPLTKNQQHKLRTVYVSAVTLGQIFNGIIDLDKADRGRLALCPESTNLAEFISGIEHIGKLMAEQAKLNFNFDLLTPLPKAIVVDSTRLRQILWNLLSNAFKFTKQGSVNINLACQIKGKKAFLHFDVEDSGIGISSLEQNNIFAMYYQVKQEDSNLHATGTGIGLAISKENATLMGGSLTVESEPDFGSTFSLKLAAPLCENHISSITPSLTKRYHLLLVEDIELNIQVATSYLNKLGHSFVVARTGKEALAYFNKEDFDLLLLDIQLPDMTGFSIAKTLRKKYSNLPPLIALTANATTDKDEYIKKGMDGVLTKPFTLEALAKTLDTAINNPANQGLKIGADKDLSMPVLAMDILEPYIEVVGVDVALKGAELFAQLMPEYLAALESNYLAQNQKGIVEQAHKIKSAASALGLQRIQDIADKAQSAHLAAWEENIQDWIEQIRLNYQQDLAALNNWLLARQEFDIALGA